MFPNVTKIIKPLSSPKYGRKLLHNLLKETLGDRQLQQIFSNIVIPTFDIKLIFLTIFSNYQDQLNHFKILFLTLFLLGLNECRTLIIRYSSFNFMDQVKCKPSLDALHSDICIGNLVPPTYLLAHYFETKDPTVKMRKFNHINGFVSGKKNSNTYRLESVSSKSQYSYIKLQKGSRICVCSIP